jgi:electron transport complex protein RnfB
LSDGILFRRQVMAYYITDKCNGCTSCAQICPTGAVTGEKKKRHSINEKYCIACGTCGRICPKESVEDSFGESVKHVKRKLWEKPDFDRDKCMACVICIDACPIGCITHGKPGKKDLNSYPELINRKACIGCGFCFVECPVDAISMEIPTE